MATSYRAMIHPHTQKVDSPLSLFRSSVEGGSEYWDRVRETWVKCYYADLPLTNKQKEITEDQANAIIKRWHNLRSAGDAVIVSPPGLWPERDGRSEVHVIWEMRKQGKTEIPYILHRDTAHHAFYSFVHKPKPTRKKGETDLSWPHVHMDTEANFIATHKELAEAALNDWGERFETFDRQEDLYHDFIWSDG